MVRVSVKPKSIIISGHADYDTFGKDIVCSSISSIVTTTVNAILAFDKKAIKYSVKKGLVKIEVIKNDDTTKTLLDNMINLFIELTRQYPDNIKVERE